MVEKNGSCPYCEKMFTETDDTVYCPQCGTPHHRECFLNHGECANAPKHEEGFVWQRTPEPQEQKEDPKPSDDEPVICPQCGSL